MDYKERKARKGHPVGIAVPVSERWNGMVEWMAKREKGKGERGNSKYFLVVIISLWSVFSICMLYRTLFFSFSPFLFCFWFLVLIDSIYTCMIR